MTTITLPRARSRGSWLLGVVVDVLGWLYGRYAQAVPGIAGACGLSAAVGGIVETYAGQGGPWVGLGMLSLFLLAMDRQIQPGGRG